MNEARGLGDDSPPLTSVPTGKRSYSRAWPTVLAVVVICALPLIAALYFRFVSPPQPAPTVGTPLTPLLMPFELLRRADGTPLEQAEIGEKWRIVIFAPGGCDARCQHSLYLTRQSRTAQGRNMTRVERLWIVSDGVPPASDLLAAHRDLVAVTAVDGRVAESLGESPQRSIYLVDRRGLLVFRYPDDAEPKAFISELGKLIKH